jgi:hypothetical protein
MDADFAQWRLWAANIRDGYPEGHLLRDKAVILCHAMNAWHTTWLYIIMHPGSTLPLEPLEIAIEKLVREMICLGALPPAKPLDTKVQKNTKNDGYERE